MKTKNFSEHLVKIQPELLCFAFKFTEDKEEANDLVQDTSLKALDNEFKYSAEVNFEGWIYTIMRNIFINNCRKLVREQTYYDNAENLYHLNSFTMHNQVSGDAFYDIREMYNILNTLPQELRDPFYMYVSGFKYREISEKLNIPIGTIKSRIYFTRLKLQEIFKDFR